MKTGDNGFGWGTVGIFALGFHAAVAAETRPDAWDAVEEPAKWYADRVETDFATPTSPLGEPVPDRIDLRGVGDTAWTRGARPSSGLPLPPRAELDVALARADPSGALLRGDLNFANWESVVGERCDTIRNTVDFYFLSHPDAVRQAIAWGFNLLGFANNHAQDCTLGRSAVEEAPASGTTMTAESLARIAGESARPFAWAGLASPGTGDDEFAVRVVPFRIGGRSILVAFASVATFGWNIPSAATILPDGSSAAEERIERILARFRESAADLRILAIHTQDASGNGRPEGPAFRTLKRIAERFVRESSGDVVFGHGPHTWGGVKLVPRPDGKRGVIFTSLGNFIHSGLRPDADNYVARALLERETLRVRELQVYPYRNLRTSIGLYEDATRTKAPNANFRWETLAARVNGATVVGYSARFRP